MDLGIHLGINRLFFHLPLPFVYIILTTLCCILSLVKLELSTYLILDIKTDISTAEDRYFQGTLC